MLGNEGEATWMNVRKGQEGSGLAERWTKGTLFNLGRSKRRQIGDSRNFNGSSHLGLAISSPFFRV